MFTEEWDSLDWEVSSQWSMKSVVLEMSVLLRVSFSFIPAYFMKPLLFVCGNKKSHRGMKEWGTEGKAA